jgi:DtxR family Mn-dependent transcriptional regulator
MVDPRLALLVFFLLGLLAAVLFWPRRGLAARILRLVRMTERVRVEDALKHLYDTETRGVTCTPESLGGALGIRPGRAVRILSRLQVLGLADPAGEGFVLTEAGRNYALRILRTHRLVERFLADRTGVAPDQWHDEAERLEHRLDDAATERLARRMGHPLYDPHGDPIPTAGGVVPEAQGQPLHTMPPGETVAVVHLEDEPPEVYQRLLASGFSLGQTLRILESDPARVRFTTDGRESSLATVLARNVTVLPFPEPAVDQAGTGTLADLTIGESAEVVGISSACQGTQRRRLLDLGVVPGTVVRAAMTSAAGDPVAYDIRGALIGLRRQQAEWIRVKPIARAEGEAA